MKPHSYAFVILIQAIVGCSPPSPDDALNSLLQQLVSAVEDAQTVAIVPSTPGMGTEQPSAFTLIVADALVAEIEAGGFRTAKPLSATVTNATTLAAGEISTDIVIYIHVREHAIEGDFTSDRVEIKKIFKADAWMYPKDSDSPFTMATAIETSVWGAPPDSVASQEILSWDSTDYPSDPDARLRVFAVECAESFLSTYHKLSENLKQRDSEGT